ncbi:MAG: WD40 repeat domain-containing serine/threonine protein kinase, partial [Isosphaeraceae bacterium]
MRDCPTRAVWNDFLADRLTAVPQADLVAHAESCPNCLSILEELTTIPSTAEAGEPNSVERPDDSAWDPEGDSSEDSRRGLGRSTLRKLLDLVPDDSVDSGGQSRTGQRFPVLPGYEVQSELARGGMGVVYRAYQVKLGRHVAVKTILAAEHATRDQTLRFLIEAESLARLRHPNIVQVFEAGEYQGISYLVMELVEGGTLSDACHGRTMPPRLAARHVEALARAIHHAHLRGVIHRDLKPSNILVQGLPRAEPTSRGAIGPAALDGAVLKITDFGLAKNPGGREGLTLSGTILGTPAYMAPEQVDDRSKDVGPAVDIHALGVILYELLTGSPPFQGRSALQVLDLVRREDPAFPLRMRASLPADLIAICLKCLRKEPSRRYASAEALADDLRRFLDHELIHARPIGPLDRLTRWCRRNPASAALVGLSVTSLLVITAGAMTAAVRIEGARKHAVASALSESRARAAAERSRREALAAVAVGRRRLAQLSAAIGDRYVAVDDTQTALLWFVDSWLQDQGDPTREASHQLRLAALLDRSPRLDGICFHPEVVLQAEFDPTGRRVLTRTGGNAAYLWNPERSRLVLPPLRHRGPVLHAAFSPDGRTIATASADGTAKLWDLEPGKPQRGVWSHPAAVHGVAFSPDGTQVATGCGDGGVRIWNTADRTLVRTFPAAESAVISVEFSPDGKLLVTADQAGFAQIWNVNDGQAFGPKRAHRAVLQSPSYQLVVPPRFSPDGRNLLTVFGSRATVRAVDSSGPRFYFNLGAEVKDAVWGPRSDRLLFGFGTTARIVPLVQSQGQGPIPGRVEVLHPRETSRAVFSPDGGRFAVASSGGLIRVWDSASGQRVGLEVRQLDFDVVQTLRFSPDSRRLLVSGRDGTVRIWDLTPESTHPIALDPSEAPERSERRRLRFGTGSGVEIVSRIDGRPLGLPIDTGAVVVSSFFRDGGRRIVTRTRSQARVWDATTSRPLGPPVPVGAALAEFQVDDRGARLAVLDRDHQVFEVWNLETGRLLFRARSAGVPPSASAGQTSRHEVQYFWKISDVGLSPNGRRVVLKSFRIIQVFDLDTGRVMASIGSDGVLGPIEFSRDSRRFALASSSTKARVWSAENGEPLGPLLPHPTFVRLARFSPDARLLLTACDDESIRIWDGLTGDLLVPAFHLDTTSLTSYSFTQDGQGILARQG